MIVPGPFGKTPASVPMTSSATGFCLDLYRIRGEIPMWRRHPMQLGSVDDRISALPLSR